MVSRHSNTAPGDALWNAQAHMPSALSRRIVVAEGHGAWVTTTDGQSLLDATAGLWHANIGHGRAELARAAADQMGKLETYHVFGRFANEPALQLADRVARLVPVLDARIFLTSGGSDAIDTACKLARAHWQLQGRSNKKVIVSRDLAYHGLHGFGTSIGGLDYNRVGYGSESLVPETARIPTYGLDAAIAQLELIGADTVAAIVTEPVLGTGGVHPPEPGYLEGLQTWARDHDVLFIVDEVITGFGRTGHMFASQRWHLSPDIMTMAKGITSGYAPLGAVAVAPTVAEQFFEGPDAAVFRHGLTYAGHATCCAVAEANLDVLRDDALIDRVAELEHVLADALEPLAAHPQVTAVRARAGFLAGIELQPSADGEAVVDACLDSGIITRVIHGNTLQVSPPFVVTNDEIEHIAKCIQRALDSVPEDQTVK